jgi:hypothetical protein
MAEFVAQASRYGLGVSSNIPQGKVTIPAAEFIIASNELGIYE